jgi:UDP-N-acetylmuramoylalanine--D-glutamate ligase
VTVAGLGHFGGGVGAARFLARLGARVTVTDLKDEASLAPSKAALSGLPIRFRLGGHDRDDFVRADLLCLSPAVPREAPLVSEAAERGVPITSEIRLFVSSCRSRRTVGVTGSNGKTTTTSFIGSILAAAGRRHFVGGNIGGSLLDRVDEIGADDVVVLELSSFQLEDLASLSFSPGVAVVTNVVPNHLDRHGTFEAYVDAKKTIVRFQGKDGVAVLAAGDSVVEGFGASAAGRKVYFSGGDLASERDGACVRDGRAVFRRGGAEEPLFSLESIRLPGRFNSWNALAAAAAVRVLGVPASAIARGVADFRGVPHRLEEIAEIAGVRFFNDSKATTPEAAALALGAFDAPVVLIAGGFDKKIALDCLASAAARRCRAAILIGETGPRIGKALESLGRRDIAVPADSLEEAVRLAGKLAAAGDVVLLSPGCASYDMFANFEERGDRFRALVDAIRI